MLSNIKNIKIELFLSLLLFVNVTIVYSLLTGSTFFIEYLVSNIVLLRVIIISVILFFSYGVVKFLLFQQIQSQLLDFFISIIILLAVMIAISIIFQDIDIGRIFRFYIAPLVFYIMLIFTLLMSLVKVEVSEKFRPVYFLLLGVLFLVIGFTIYLLKDNFSLTRNVNFFIQFTLSLLCVVLPINYTLLAVFTKLKRY